jgi:ATP-dependent Clp protease ATP-binding subunit ClpA
MDERLTDRYCRVIQWAREEAHLLGHENVDSKHILLALVSEGHGVAARVLMNLLHVKNLRNIRREIEAPVE